MGLSKKRKIGILIGILPVVILVLNFNYFLANFRYLFGGRTYVYVFSESYKRIPKKMQANWLEISSLNISAPVVYVTENSETVYQKALEQGVVHFPGTSNPGDLGNAYFFGHSSDFFWNQGKYKTVFAVLPSISLGAEINISDENGNKFTYVVTSSRRVSANDLSVLDQKGNTKKLITLQTSYPVGTALARWVVTGEIQ